MAKKHKKRAQRMKKIDVSEEAEVFFRETGDYRYVAIAIGQSPSDPPHWARWACQLAFWNNEQQAPNSDTRLKAGHLLDLMILFFKESQDSPGARIAVENATYKPPKVARAMAYAFGRIGVPEEDTDHYKSEERKLRRAWDAELKAGTLHKGEGPYLIGFPRATPRMIRMLRGADLSGLPLSNMPYELGKAFKILTNN